MPIVGSASETVQSEAAQPEVAPAAELSPYGAAKAIYGALYVGRPNWTTVFQSLQGQRFAVVSREYSLFGVADLRVDLLHRAPPSAIADVIQHLIDDEQVAALASRIKADLEASPCDLGDIDRVLFPASPDLCLAIAESFDTQYRDDLPRGPPHPTDFLKETLIHAGPGLIRRWDLTRWRSISRSLEAAKRHASEPIPHQADKAVGDVVASLQAGKAEVFALIEGLGPGQRLLLGQSESFKNRIRAALGGETPEFHMAMAMLYDVS
jgi:hypothetical protein